ncbi:GNAT family N-acetyltransferase [Actinoallomurus rhizosphaericola]|uniref:GNAT family N-acetyltransferase n=1 Tax=Actinoallomurus rhizosphaericola TaxID=2952536 RepID=UPI0020900350|nr:GNAT family N-acetyltransferase [Actinoallomurus rhizosphaericola]MCO5991749.1 GNAT family N-acetyltransferase [Actinoallomurus rhizosphaericola]
MSQEKPPVLGSPGEPPAPGTPAGIEIRVARPEELRAIGELTATVYVAAGYISPNGSYVPYLRDAASRARDAELVVAARGGEPIGTVTYCRHDSAWAQLAGPKEAEFRMLAVNPMARGLGLGEALVRYCIRRAREDGCTTLRLSTEPVMHAAHRIYRRLGFVRTPDRDWSPTPGGELLTYALAL